MTFAIVEDEYIEREGMSLFITDHFPSDEVIWECENGAKALSQLETQVPDILIVDVEMPVMDGLELCRILYERGYPGVILIHSAYDKFAYTRRAIQLKVYDYIIKPVEDDELYETLERCRREAARRRQAALTAHTEREEGSQELAAAAFSQLLSPSQEDASSFFRALNWPPQEEICAFVFHFYAETALPAACVRSLKELTEYLQTQGMHVLLQFPDDMSGLLILQKAKETDLAAWYTIGWTAADLVRQILAGGAVFVDALCHSYGEILEACRKDIPMKPMQDLSFPQRTWQCLRKSERASLEGTLDRYFREGSHTRIQALAAGKEEAEETALPRSWELAQIFLKTVRKIWNGQDFSAFEKQLCHSDVDPRQWMQQLDAFAATLDIHESEKTIEVVLEWMRKEFPDGLTQGEVAQRLGMDGGYFSRFFKKKTGRKFSDVMTQIRMEHAQKLMDENPSITLEQLCEACGLTSSSYFSEAFKKWKGMTVTQYLSRNRQ